jgi:hypothetical protein
MKKRKVYETPLLSHALRYRSVSFRSDNSVYLARSCRRSTHILASLGHQIYAYVTRNHSRDSCISPNVGAYELRGSALSLAPRARDIA